MFDVRFELRESKCNWMILITVIGASIGPNFEGLSTDQADHVKIVSGGCLQTPVLDVLQIYSSKEFYSPHKECLVKVLCKQPAGPQPKRYSPEMKFYH